MKRNLQNGLIKTPGLELGQYGAVELCSLLQRQNQFGHNFS